MSTDSLPAKSEFQIMDDADNQQIAEAETAIKQALCYTVRGKKQLSYMGIKWLVLKMSQKDQPLQVLDMPEIILEKHDKEDKSTWVWYCTIKMKNAKTDLVTVGASESPYLVSGIYDSFGRTKALSKAERNACRKQIPELEINTMMETIDSEDVKVLQTSFPSSNYNVTSIPATSANKVDTTAPTDKQLSYLDKLKYTGEKPKTKIIASDLIDKLIRDAKTAATKPANNNNGYKKNCSCDRFVPNPTNGNFCTNCKKLKPDEDKKK